MTASLPPGVSREAMDEALNSFSEIVGREWVFSGEQLASYADPYTISNEESDYRSYAAVGPASTEEVQRIVKVANELNIPLWPVSRVNNFTYDRGATSAPTTSSTLSGRARRQCLPSSQPPSAMMSWKRLPAT